MSQSSDVGSLANLSQDSLARILGTVGMSGSEGNVLTNCFTAQLGDDDLENDFESVLGRRQDGDILDPSPGTLPGSSALLPGSSSISVRRAVFRQSDGQVVPSTTSQHLSGFGSQLLTSTSAGAGVAGDDLSSSNDVTPACSPFFPSTCDESPLLPGLSNSNLSLSQGSFPLTPVDNSRVVGGASGYLVGHLSSSAPRPTIPLNTPFEGEYGFKFLDFSELRTRTYRNSNFIYSDVVKKAFIKIGVTVPFYFFVTSTPPEDCVLKAMAIHKSPENIGDSLVCCPTHLQSNIQQGFLYPHHFIRPTRNDKETVFCGSHANHERLSIKTPFTALQKKSDTCYAALYQCPCYTSDFNSKTAQLVQFIFTLERGYEVLGRATLDVRVCSSLTRDRSAGEKKQKKQDGNEEEEQSFTNGRKRSRAANNQIEVMKYTLPPKRICEGQVLSRQRVPYTIETFPEVIPYIKVCVQMMEAVHCVPTEVDQPGTSTSSPPLTGTSSLPTNEPNLYTLDGWLDHLGLTRYRKLLESNGISDISQILTLTDEELSGWGMKTAVHRKTFLEGLSLISTKDSLQPNDTVELESTQPVSEPPPPQFLHQFSSQSFEVMEITVSKSISSSSSSQSSS